MPRSADLLERKIQWAVDFDALPEHIETIHRYPSLSESELIDLAITFANTGDEQAYSSIRIGFRLPEPRLDELAAENMQRSDRWLRGKLRGETLIEFHRKVLCSDMTAIAGKSVKPVMLANWRQRVDEGLMLFPKYREDGSVSYRWVDFRLFEPPAPLPQLAHVLLALSGGANADKLCQCKLSSCQHFFLAARPAGSTGRPIRDYCPGTDHRDQAHRAGAVERMRKSRAKKRRAMKTRRRSSAIK